MTGRQGAKWIVRAVAVSGANVALGGPPWPTPIPAVAPVLGESGFLAVAAGLAVTGIFLLRGRRR